MSDPVFLKPQALTLAALLRLTGATAPPGAAPERLFRDLATLDTAGPDAITVAEPGARAEDLARTMAGACLVTGRQSVHLPASTLAIVTEAPALAFAKVVATLAPGAARPSSAFGTRGISPSAFVHSEARLEPGVIIDPGAVVGPHAEIGSRTVIGANSVIGAEVRIGRDCAIGPQVSITHALIGNDVVIQAGARIGQSGVGGAPSDALGRVIIQDRTEIGANATIDRGNLADTVLGEASRIPNQAHVTAGTMIARGADAKPAGGR